jgi:hypothetical protein
MKMSQPDLDLSQMTRGQVLWEYMKESAVTEARTTLGLLVAPILALSAGSLEPIKSAFQRSLDEGDRVFDRYWPSRNR